MNAAEREARAQARREELRRVVEQIRQHRHDVTTATPAERFARACIAFGPRLATRLYGNETERALDASAHGLTH